MQQVSQNEAPGAPHSEKPSGKHPKQPPLWPIGWALVSAFVAAAVLIAAAWLVLSWLLGFPDRLPAKSLDTKTQLDLLKLVFATVAGIGGIVALVTAYRRQRVTERGQEHAERVAEDTAYDAAERRITELYTKAADQLGSEKAPVRLAGLYALERLAQDNPGHRQTIVNVICAYLRMPYESPAQQHVVAPEASPNAAMGRPGSTTSHDTASREELLVRRAAQEIITKHLHTNVSDTEWPRRSVPSDPDFWPDIRLNLDGATLVDFEFVGRRVNFANFSGARFIGGANFAHADFDGHVFFTEARFERGGAHFLGAWFGLRAVFVNTDFGKQRADFREATFAGIAGFRDASFEGTVTFEGARALEGFDTYWGSERDWPPGWTERQIAAGEQIPRPKFGRWAEEADKAPREKWRFIIRRDDEKPS